MKTKKIVVAAITSTMAAILYIAYQNIDLGITTGYTSNVVTHAQAVNDRRQPQPDTQTRQAEEMATDASRALASSIRPLVS